MILRNREKILITFAILALIFWSFDRFYYMPQKQKIAALKGEIAATDSKLKQAMALRQGAEAIEKEISHLQKELQAYQERVLPGEEMRAFLNQLAKESERLKIKIISLGLEEEKGGAPEEQIEKAPEYKKVIVRLAMHAPYGSLENFLNHIERFPFLISLDHLKIERQEEKYPNLLITLEMRVGVSKKEPQK